MNSGKQLRSPLFYAIFIIVIALVSKNAYAYVGPGAGITMLGALWAVVISILLAVIAILFWPVRFLIRKMRAKKEEKPEEETG